MYKCSASRKVQITFLQNVYLLGFQERLDTVTCRIVTWFLLFLFHKSITYIFKTIGLYAHDLFIKYVPFRVLIYLTLRVVQKVMTGQLAFSIFNTKYIRIWKYGTDYKNPQCCIILLKIGVTGYLACARTQVGSPQNEAPTLDVALVASWNSVNILYITQTTRVPDKISVM